MTMASFYRSHAARLPADYVSFLESHAPYEGDLGDVLGYVRLWSPGEIDESYIGHEMEEFLSSGWFPIGSNMGGEMLVLNLASGSESVYRLPFIGMSDEEPWLLCESYSELINAAAQAENHA